MWSWVTPKPLPKLDRPPVVEVICGLCFAPLDLDPVVAGAYWDTRKGEYPRRQLHPAIERGLGPGILINATPRMRVWLLSDDGSQILQMQSDRFYMNWRKTPNTDYPRFSTSSGLCARSLGEFERFSSFCETSLGQRPVVDRIELGKVDHMLEGDSWNGLPDLGVMLPGLASMLTFSEGTGTAVASRFQEQLGSATLNIAIDTTLTMAPGRAPTRGVRIDTTVSMPLGDLSTKSCFEQANNVANSVFTALIPEPERARRFARQEGASNE
jgi:uncharacterized protein (TIGR04255 family)